MEGRYFPRENQCKTDQLETPHELMAKERTLFLYGPMYSFMYRADVFGTTLVSDLMLALDKKNVDPINLIIDSPGGMISAGFALYDTMRTVQSPIRTIGRSCQSMATVILAAGNPGERYIYPHARIMLHLPQGAVQGDAKEIEIQQREMEELKNQIIDALIECGVHRTRRQVEKDIDREYWMSAEETIKYGIADKVIDKDFKF